MGINEGLAEFDAGRNLFFAALAGAPEASLGYLKTGDDYSLGGLVVHVNHVLDHYGNVLDTMIAADFAECRSTDPEGQEARAIAKAKTHLSPDEVKAESATTERLHRRIATLIQTVGPNWERKAPVFFGDAAETYPTSAADVLGWVTGHYQEHVPHISSLVADWEKASGDPNDAMAVVDAFNRAFGAGDVDGVMALMTDDCLFDNTFPAPDGELHRGQADVRRFWEEFFASTTEPKFETEEAFASGDRVLARWRFSWGGDNPGHVRGVDVFRVRDGKVAEKFSYVKG